MKNSGRLKYLCLIILLLISLRVSSSDLFIRSLPRFTDLDFECIVQNGNDLYMGGEDNYLFYSYDSGLNWEKVKLRRGGGNVSDVLPISGNMLLATGGMYDDNYICKSIDNGKTWERVWYDGSIELTTLIKLRDGTVLGFGEDDEYVRSLNRQYNQWDEIDRDWNAADYNEEQIWDAELIDGDKVVLAGDEGLLLSFNTTMNSYNWIGTHRTEVSDIRTLTNVGRGVLLVGTGDGAIYYSSNRGAHWEKTFVDSVHNSLINGIAVDPQGNGFAVGHNGLIARTKDFGKTWKVHVVGNENAYNDVAYLNNSMFMVIGDDGIILTIKVP